MVSVLARPAELGKRGVMRAAMKNCNSEICNSAHYHTPISNVRKYHQEGHALLLPQILFSFQEMLVTNDKFGKDT